MGYTPPGLSGWSSEAVKRPKTTQANSLSVINVGTILGAETQARRSLARVTVFEDLPGSPTMPGPRGWSNRRGAWYWFHRDFQGEGPDYVDEEYSR
jgi:hypothetical protein